MSPLQRMLDRQPHSNISIPIQIPNKNCGALAASKPTGQELFNAHSIGEHSHDQEYAENTRTLDAVGPL
jgi:hypothetical protein